MKKAMLLVLLLVAAILLSGCLKMQVDIVWNEDNTGTMTMTQSILKGSASIFGMSDDDILNQMKDSYTEDEDFTSIETFSDDDYVGIIMTMEIEDVTDNSQDDSFTSQLRFRSEGEGNKRTYSVSGSISGDEFTGEAGMEELGVSTDDIEMKMSITMPGTIVSHNAHEQKGNKLTWDLTASDFVKIEAESKAGGGFMTILMWILFVLGLLLLAGAVILIIMQKSKGSNNAAKDANNAPGAYNAPGTYNAPDAYNAPGTYNAPDAYNAPGAYNAPDSYGYAPPQQATTVQCNRCGSVQPAGTQFCGVCGNAISNH